MGEDGIGAQTPMQAGPSGQDTPGTRGKETRQGLASLCPNAHGTPGRSVRRPPTTPSSEVRRTAAGRAPAPATPFSAARRTCATPSSLKAGIPPSALKSVPQKTVSTFQCAPEIENWYPPYRDILEPVDVEIKCLDEQEELFAEMLKEKELRDKHESDEMERLRWTCKMPEVELEIET